MSRHTFYIPPGSDLWARVQKKSTAKGIHASRAIVLWLIKWVEDEVELDLNKDLQKWEDLKR